MLRVLPPGLKKYPSHIDELSDDKAAIERHRQHLGLLAAERSAATSSSGPVASSSGPEMFNIASPKAKQKAIAKHVQVRAKSTKGTKGETSDPETNVSKPLGRRPDPNSARQKKLAAKK